MQLGAQRDRDDKGRAAEEHQASGRLSTQAADSVDRRRNRRLQTDTNIGANPARESVKAVNDAARHLYHQSEAAAVIF